MTKNILKVPNKLLLLFIVFFGFLLIIMGLFYSSFSLLEPIKNVSFTSEKLNYEEKEPGSFRIEKSAEWISKRKARVSINVDTIQKINPRFTDLIFVMDVSFSMTGTKLQKAKEGAKELFNSILSTSGNRIALVTFDDTSTILSEFTNDCERLNNLIDGLYDRNNRSYYQAFTSIDELLRDYQFEEDRDCIVLFLAGGTANQDTPNEENYFKYLKNAYPYMTLNAIQYQMNDYVKYQMTDYISEKVTKFSDNQYVADTNSLKQVLFDASIVSVPFLEFTITDYMDTTYFEVKSQNDIKVSNGIVDFNEKEQKITWNLNNLRSGLCPTMTIDIVLKDEYLSVGGIYPTNKKLLVHSKIENNIMDIDDDNTPRLKNQYQVRYEANAPSNCSISNVPEKKDYFTFDAISVEEAIECDGYQFKGWKIATDNVNRPADNYFIMPENDVVLKAEWTKFSAYLSIDGNISQYATPVLQKVASNNYNEKIWKYKSSITKIVIEDVIRDIPEAVETFDLSETGNWGVVGLVVPNTDDVSATTYTAYIQGEEKIIANQNSSCLFSGFKVLESIDGLEYLDTSEVTSMSSMFSECGGLTSLDLSNFDTSNVTNMNYMFVACSGFESLDLSNFNTSNVTDMRYMFHGCWGLKELNLSNFDTPKVVDMRYMFYNCSQLKNLDFNQIDTSGVTNMESMFALCYNLNYELYIYNSNLTGYASIFKDAATESDSKIIVHCTSATSDLVDAMILTKSENSNVVKGTTYQLHSITMENTSDAFINFEEAYFFQRIELSSNSVDKRVVSFKLNNVLVSGNSFYMPDEEVTITDIRFGEVAYFGTNHNLYSVVLENWSFEKSKILTVLVDLGIRNNIVL